MKNAITLFFKKLTIIITYILFQCFLGFIVFHILKIILLQFSTEGMGSVFNSHFFYFGLLLIFTYFFGKKFLKILQNTFTFPFDILFVNRFTNKGKIFLQKISTLNFKNFLKLYIFYIKVYKNPNSEISDKEVIYYFSSKKFHKYIEQINNLLQNHILKGSYVSDFEEIEKNYFCIKITKETETNENLKKKILVNKNAILEIFEKNYFSPDLKIEANKDDFLLYIFDKNLLWQTKYFDEKIIKNREKGEILLGFSPKNNNGISYENTLIFAHKMFHTLIVGASRSGKDILTNNIIFSILYNIKNFSNAELHFFDTKKSDGIYLQNLKSHGIFCYEDYEKYGDILEKFVKEMQETQKTIGIHSSIENYNIAKSHNPLKYKFIVINEFLALGSMLKGKELQKLTSSLIALTSQGASAGIKCIFISQSMRSDGVDDFAKILLNIKTKFVLKLNNITESNIIARGLDETDSEIVRNIGEYRTLQIEDNEIKQKFKAYLLEQEDLKKWIGENFEVQKYEQLANMNSLQIKYKIIITFQRIMRAFPGKRLQKDFILQEQNGINL